MFDLLHMLSCIIPGLITENIISHFMFEINNRKQTRCIPSAHLPNILAMHQVVNSEELTAKAS